MKWEYTSVSAISADTLLQKLNAGGRDGWELVSIVTSPQGHYVAVLKKTFVAEGATAIQQ